MPELPSYLQLVSTDEDDFTADEELAAVVDPDDADTSDDVETRPFGRSWLVNPDTGLVVTYNGLPIEVQGKDAGRMWCLIAIKTQRFMHAIAPEDYGMEQPTRPLGYVYSAERNEEYARDIRDALLQHDRIVDVRDFQFRGDLDSTVLEMDCTVIWDDDEETRLESVTIS